MNFDNVFFLSCWDGLLSDLYEMNSVIIALCSGFSIDFKGTCYDH